MATPKKTNPGISNPLQLFGLYLAWSETAMAAGLFAVSNTEHWTRYFLIFMMGLGVFGYLSISGFLLIYLAMKKPAFLFNPSDYDKSVQPHLFEKPLPRIEVSFVDPQGKPETAQK